MVGSADDTTATFQHWSIKQQAKNPAIVFIIAKHGRRRGSDRASHNNTQGEPWCCEFQISKTFFRARLASVRDRGWLQPHSRQDFRFADLSAKRDGIAPYPRAFFHFETQSDANTFNADCTLRNPGSGSDIVIPCLGRGYQQPPGNDCCWKKVVLLVVTNRLSSQVSSINAGATPSCQQDHTACGLV
jgi:hypothetical protein